MIQNSLNGSGRSSPGLSQSFYTRKHHVAYTKMLLFPLVESASCIRQWSHLTCPSLRKRGVEHCMIFGTMKKKIRHSVVYANKCK